MMDLITIFMTFGVIKVVQRVSFKKIVLGDAIPVIHHVNGVMIIVDLVALNANYRDLWKKRMIMIL